MSLQEIARTLIALDLLHILLIQAPLRYKQKEMQRKVGTGRRTCAPAISERISKILWHKEVLVKKMWTEYVKHETDFMAIDAGKCSTRAGLITNAR